MGARSDGGSPLTSTHHEPPPHSTLDQRLLDQRELLHRELLHRELLQRELLHRELLQRELLQRELLGFSTANWLRSAPRCHPPPRRASGKRWRALLGTEERVAAAASTTPAPWSAVSVPASGRAVERSSALTWSGSRRGRAPTTSAAAPVTTAVACEVPEPRKPSPTRAAGKASSRKEPGDAGGDDGDAGGDDVRAARVRAAARERRHAVVGEGGGAARVLGADGDHVGVIGGRVEAVGVAAAVAGGGDDHDTGVPGLLDGVGERIVAVGAVGLGAEGEVEDAHVETVAVAAAGGPVDAGQDAAERRGCRRGRRP